MVFASGAGAGYFRWAPGTMGTLVALPLSVGLNRIAAAGIPLALVTLAAFVLLAVWVAGRGEQLFGRKDAQRIVIDEIAGFLVANFLWPLGLKSTVFSFLLFRIFDIIKPYPVRRAERLHGGLGVVLDDLIAGLYTFVSLRFLIGWGFL
jgi:phosphatidylglycerophosphatase A